MNTSQGTAKKSTPANESSAGISLMDSQELGSDLNSTLNELIRLNQEQRSQLSRSVNYVLPTQKAQLHRLLKKYTNLSTQLRTLIVKTSTRRTALEGVTLCQQVRSLNKSLGRVAEEIEALEKAASPQQYAHSH